MSAIGREHGGPSPRGNVVEIFSGIQGEGLFVGRRQVFLRMAECNLDCAYCDTPESRTVPPYARVQLAPESEAFQLVGNPLSVNQVAGFVARLHTPGRLQPALAVTGGEPLLQAEFLAALLPHLREQGLVAMLETNGSLPEELEKVVDLVDVIAMDLKLASAGGQGTPEEVTRRFLEVGGARDLFVKVVVTSETEEVELSRALKVVRAVRPESVVVLQPVTAEERVTPPSPKKILRLERTAAAEIKNVRVIPQLHRVLALP